MSKEKQRELEGIYRPMNEEFSNNLENQYRELAKVKAESEQIEEMANALYKIVNARKGKASMLDLATDLYNADYRKQIEGEWIAKDNFNGRCTIATCSNCGTEKAFAALVSIDTIATLYPYCQKCGAKMKGGESDA